MDECPQRFSLSTRAADRGSRTSLFVASTRLSSRGGPSAREILRQNTADVFGGSILGCPGWTALKSSSNCRDSGSTLRSSFCRAAPMRPARSPRNSTSVRMIMFTKPFGMDEFAGASARRTASSPAAAGERPIFRVDHLGLISCAVVDGARARGGSSRRASTISADARPLMQAKVLTHRFLLREVWGSETDVAYLRIYVRTLRQKIEADPGSPQLITTEQGVANRSGAD